MPELVRVTDAFATAGHALESQLRNDRKKQMSGFDTVFVTFRFVLQDTIRSDRDVDARRT